MTHYIDVMEGPRFKEVYELLKDQPRIETVKRVNLQSFYDQFDLIKRAGYPVIVTDYGKGCKQTILSNLCEKYGEIIYKARKGNYCDPIVTITSSREYEFISIMDYVNLISEGKGTSLYAAAQVIENIALSDLFTSYPEAYTKEEFETPSLWIGPKGSITPLHKDSRDNFIHQIVGAKRWWLYPVRDIPWLYMSILPSRPNIDLAVSRIDLRNVDLTKFPDFTKAKCVKVFTMPGEMLYLPMGWGHYVECVEDFSIMVNYWLKLK
ncbi:MAG: cupin-like domain-containing protein [Phormidium sp.]